MSVTTMPAAGEAPAEEKKGGKKKLIMIVVLALVVGGAGYWFFLKPKPAASEKPKPEAGIVVPLEPIQVNLEGGHYLKIGIALQLTKAAKEADGSKALDAVIATFSGMSMNEVTKPDEREKVKEELAKKLEKLYEDEVMDVYYTDFVTQ